MMPVLSMIVDMRGRLMTAGSNLEEGEALRVQQGVRGLWLRQANRGEGKFC